MNPETLEIDRSVESCESANVCADINRRLSDLLKIPPADLAVGADSALGDDLVLCGILGGKDVGKSTLINALAGAGVSEDAEEVGRGTDRPIAYVHEDSRAGVTRRLQSIDAAVPLDISTHHADAIRNVVLIDLPDFDSEFLTHLEIVRAVAPRLDRILWVMTPRKIGDRAWVGMLHTIVKDAGNVHCVLNKVDELLSDGDPFEVPHNGNGRARHQATNDPAQLAEQFWTDQHRWLADAIRPVDFPDTHDHRFLVAAAFPQPAAFVQRVGERWDDPDWKRYVADRGTVQDIADRVAAELSRLRDCVLSPVTGEETRAIKQANRAEEMRVNVARLEAHYDLERTLQRLARASDPDYHQDLITEAFDPAYRNEVEQTLHARMPNDRAIADELLDLRVERWPLLRLVYWPFGWLSRLVGASRGLQSARSGASDRSNVITGRLANPFDAGGQSLVHRVDFVRARMLADNAVIARQLDIEPAIPVSDTLAGGVHSAAQNVIPQLEQRLVDSLRARDRRPSIFGKLLLWIILLWFPFLQPVLAGLLEIIDAGGTLRTTHGLYKIVSALSAAHLLAGFAVVVAIYVALLAGMYARALRHVRIARAVQNEQSPVADAVDEILLAEVAVPLSAPFRERLEKLRILQRHLAGDP